ncbi:MAG TPA: aminotransferase class IV [Phycisphaerales bacterium]|nr:aminotransferase class IV [Phycisphaerales bacterium]
MLVWLNGKFVDRDAAMVSLFDAGFQHGVGLFETMLARNGSVFRVEQHMQRLADSARELLLSERLRIEPLGDAVNLAVQRNNLREARVRLSVTGGNLSLLQSEGKRGGPVDPTIAIVVQPPTPYPDHFFERGVLATIADGRVNPHDPMAGHKTLNYWGRIRALQDAAGKRAGEALWFSIWNHLAGGCVSNAFLVKDGSLLTPIARGEEETVAGSAALRAPVLPGITREAIRELAESLDIDVTMRMLDINDVLGADEVFLTNSSWGVLPVVGVEREKIAGGEVGPITRQLRDAWLRLVDDETRTASI